MLYTLIEHALSANEWQRALYPNFIINGIYITSYDV